MELQHKYPIYELLINLEELKPAVWRRVAVRAGTSLRELHFIIQAVMPWDNSHLYNFQIPSSMEGASPQIYGDYVLLDGMIERENDDRLIYIEDVFTYKESKLQYLYDFGDSWEHTITVGRICNDPLEYYTTPYLIDSKGVCPPEDCGGVAHYAYILEVLGNKKHKDHKQMKEMSEEMGWEFEPVSNEELRDYLSHYKVDMYYDGKDLNSGLVAGWLHSCATPRQSPVILSSQTAVVSFNMRYLISSRIMNVNKFNYHLKSLIIAVVIILKYHNCYAQVSDSGILAVGKVKGTNRSFIQSKRMTDKDLQKKKEGTFVTGIPDFSSDPVTGVGFGVRTNVFWNGRRTDSLFAYTPYLIKLKANAAYYTSNARELVLSLDMPYYRGTRWRFKVDFKAQQNPANLYFGLTEKTLENLSLPSDPSKKFATYREFDLGRKTLRAGGLGEANMVSDALSNRFRETEYMLNLKADYALGNGKWRVMGGYEIQHLKYLTFENSATEAIDPATGATREAPNGISLLRRDFEQGLISGLEGGWVSLIQTALIRDTRDFEPDPSQGSYFELANEYSSNLIGSQFTFNKIFVQGRYYQKLPFGSRTVLAGRVAAGNIFGNQAPFFEFQDQWSPDGSINSLGGKQSLRGYRANRFLARAVAFANMELRYRIAEVSVWKQNFSFALAPFVDAGTVRDSWQDLDFNNFKFSYGGGARVAWNQSTILSFDFGFSNEDRLFFFGLGQAF